MLSDGLYDREEEDEEDDDTKNGDDDLGDDEFLLFVKGLRWWRVR
jgi:hypothetical protein